MSATQDKFPPGLNNAYLFATFNALSFQIVLNSPMVLYGKSLGASATVLGIITGMMPLLVIFQIPAAQYIDRVGYRRFVYAGWGTRVSFIFGMTLVPVTGFFLNATTRLALLLALLFGFNLSRGISSCAWLPWISQLVPPAVRGRYLARDAAFVNLASFVTYLLAALCLGVDPQAWQFAVLFAFSAVMGAASLVFLKRIPDCPPPAQEKTGKGPVPWGEIVRFPPFRKLLRTAVTWSVAYGGMTAFTVLFLKSETAMSERAILGVSSVSFLGGLCSLWFLGSRLDHLGSKPVLMFSFLTWLGIIAGWGALAGGVIEVRLGVILGLQFLLGLFAALVQMSHTRLVMAVSPVMGRNHFLALYSVLSSVALGLSPILWGLLIDAVGPTSSRWLSVDWNRYTVFFSATGAVMALALLLATRLEEPQAVSMEDLLKEILVQSPQRVWMKLWPRAG
ncbi:MAG: MFS transporter [Verrucomicrobia bacterium]|nr:MFS transporter [Verrucomicrobiota bacterium]